MKVIIPLAGFGTRLRPHTYSRPKPLINVAGKPVLAHLLDKLQGLPIEEYLFITGYLGEQIEEFVRSKYPHTPSYFFEQKVLNGQSTAIYLAKERLSGPVIVLFVDTIFETDLSFLAATDAEAVAFVKEVPDPRRFGVAAVDGQGIVTRFIEKPPTAENKLAVIGMYYLRQAETLVAAIETQIAENRQTKGEFYLADAFQIMIDRGTRFQVAEVDAWLDAGTADAVLETNRLLLERGSDNSGLLHAEGYVVIPPVHIAKNAKIVGSVIGPYVTIAENCVIENSIIRDSIIDRDTTVLNALLTNSLVGRNAYLAGRFHVFNVGDSTSLSYE